MMELIEHLKEHFKTSKRWYGKHYAIKATLELVLKLVVFPIDFVCFALNWIWFEWY